MKSLDTIIDKDYLKRKYFPIRASENISQSLEALNGRSIHFGETNNKGLIKAANLISNNSIIKSDLFKEPVSFQMVMKWPLLVGQCLGLVILGGISEKDSSKLRFKLISLRFIYSMLIFLLQLGTMALCAARFFRVKVNFNITTFLIYYGGIALTTALFIRIGLRWQSLMRRVAKSELADPIFDTNLKNKCLFATIILMCMALLEHVLSQLSKVSAILRCYSNFSEIVVLYTEQNYAWFYEVFTPSNLTMRLAIHSVLQILNIIASLNWSFSDLFIICVSYYLAARLENVYRKLKAARKRQMSVKFWSTIREDYNRVARLVHDMDDVINKAIFVSFASNLFFICLQLYNAFSQGVADNRNSLSHCETENENRLSDNLIYYRATLKGTTVGMAMNCSSCKLFFGYEHTIYYLFSLGFLLSRSLAASLIAAKVHSASLLFAPELYSVPTSLYCIEIQRFLDQLHGDKVALSGFQFFKVTRGLVLSVAGTVVTYELVLLQLNVNNNDADIPIPPAYNNSNNFVLF